MKTIYLLPILILSILACQPRISPELQYIDRTKPTLEPRIFAKGFISKDSVAEFGSVFNRENDVFYFAVDSAKRACIKYTEFLDGAWTEPRTIIADPMYSFNDPFLSNDEKRLYYISDKPRNEQDTIKDYDIWYSDREGNGWSAPINAGPTINTDAHEYYISFVSDGAMYFASNKGKSEKRQHDFDIYKSVQHKGVYQEPQKVSDAINSRRYEADVFVAPDESYIIFCSARKTGLGRGDLYISFKDGDGAWTPSINMGEPINSSGHELCPFVTKDGKYFFYTSNKDIYWVSTAIFDEMRVKALAESKKVVQVNSTNVSAGATTKLKFTSGIRAIFEDSKGNYWFGSSKEGVALYDGSDFRYFTEKDGLADAQVRTILEDEIGNVWISTAHGISSYDGKKMTKHTPQGKRAETGKWTKTDTDLWFSAGNQKGVYKYDGQKVDYLAFPEPKVINPYNVYNVTDVAQGRHDTVWIATFAGIFGYDGADFVIINDETLGLRRETGGLHIRSILEDSKGRLWIGNNGIGVLLKENDTTINFSERQNLMHPLSKNRGPDKSGDKSPAGTLEHVFVITEDRHGNIWFGDRDAGIWKYDGGSMKNYTKKDGFVNDFALSIFEDKKGDLWFGMKDGSIYKFNGKVFEKQF